MPVAKLIAEAAATVRALADERKVRVVCPESPGLAVRVDINQVRLALVNLLRNAIEAAPAEGWASIRVQREACGDLAFVVEDNGPGFAQTNMDESEPHIALANIQQRLEIMCGGKLTVMPREGGGTVVKVILPETT
jgi:signal transduction histidine kinase